MISQGKLPVDPVKLLTSQYIKPIGLSANQFALSASIGRTRFREVLSGKSKMGPALIEKISKYTKTCRKFWLLLLLEHEYHSYQLKEAFNISITPIKYLEKQEDLKALGAKVGRRSPGEYLMNHVLLAEKISINELRKRLNVERDVIIKLLKGERDVDIGLSCKLGAILMNPQFWLKLQMSFEINQTLSRKNLPINLRQQLKRYDRKLHCADYPLEGQDCRCPAQVLKNDYLNPVKIEFWDWCQLFCISKKRMSSILAGRTQFPLKMIIKLSIVFGTSVDFWLDLRLNHAIKKALRNTGQRKIQPRVNSIKAINHNTEPKMSSDTLGVIVKT